MNLQICSDQWSFSSFLDFLLWAPNWAIFVKILGAFLFKSSGHTGSVAASASEGDNIFEVKTVHKSFAEKRNNKM